MIIRRNRVCMTYSKFYIKLHKHTFIYLKSKLRKKINVTFLILRIALYFHFFILLFRRPIGAGVRILLHNGEHTNRSVSAPSDERSEQPTGRRIHFIKRKRRSTK